MENVINETTMIDKPLTDTEKEVVNALAVKPADNEFALMEKADEMQILSELAGEVEQTEKSSWFYKLPSGAIGISKKGADAYRNRCAEMGYPINVTLTPVEFTERIDAIYAGVNMNVYSPEEAKELLKPFVENMYFKATAVDTKTGQRIDRICGAPLKVYQKGGLTDSKFVERIAQAFAERNAITSLMTAQVKAQILLIAMREGYSPQKLSSLVTNEQLEVIRLLSTSKTVEWIKRTFPVEQLSELTSKQASSLIVRLKQAKGSE